MIKHLTLIPLLLFAPHLPLKGSGDPAVHMLPNGIHTYIWERPESDEDIELRLVIPVGLIHEREGEGGVVATLAHQMTSYFSEHKEISQRLLKQMGGYHMLQDFERLDTTYISLSIPIDKRPLIAEAIELFATWAWKWTPRESCHPFMFSHLPIMELAAYAGRESLESFIGLPDEKTLSEFYHKTYRSLPLAVIAVGNFDATWVEEVIAQAFSSTPSGDLGPLSSPTPSEKWLNQIEVFKDPNSPSEHANIYLPHSSSDRLTPREIMANYFLFDIITSRLESLLQLDPFKFTNNSLHPTKASTFEVIYLNCPPSHLISVCLLLDAELKKIASEGVSRAELEKTRSSIYPKTFDNQERFPFEQSALANSCMDHFRGIFPFYNDEFYKGLQTATATMTVDDMKMLAKTLKPLNKGRILAIIPEQGDIEATKAGLEGIFKQ